MFTELKVVNLFEVHILTSNFYFLEEEKAQAYLDGEIERHPEWIYKSYLQVRRVIGLCVDEMDQDGLIKTHYLLPTSVQVSIQ